MSRHSVAVGLEKAKFPASSSTPVKLIVDPTTGCMLAYGTTVPSGAAGYAVGALFIHTDGSSGTGAYVNDGTASSCSFSAVAAATATLQTAFAAGASVTGAAAATPMYVGDGTDSLSFYATNASNMAYISTGGSADLTIAPAGGDVTLTGTLTVSSTVTSTGDFTVGSSKVVVTAATGAIAIASTGGITVDTNKFIVTGAGNVTVAGDLAVTGTITGTYAFTGMTGNPTFTLTATTGAGVYIDAQTVTTGDALKILADASLSSGYFIRCIDVATDKFSVAEDGRIAIAGTATGTNAIAVTAGDITLTAGKITLSSGYLTAAPTGVSAQALVLTGSGARTAALASITDTPGNGGITFDIATTASNNAARVIKIVETGTVASNCIDISYAGASTGDAIAITMTNANAAANALVITSAAAPTAPLINITSTGGDEGVVFQVASTASHAHGNVIEIVESGTVANSLIDLSYGGASIGDAITITMTNSAATANAIQITDAGARASTVPLIAITAIPGNGGNVLEVASTATNANGGIIQITESGAVASNLIELAYGGANTGDAINITMTNAAVTSQALVINAGAVAHTGKVVNVASTGYVGAASTGMVHIEQSTATLANAAASMCYLAFSGVAAANGLGDALRVIDTGATAASYAVYISATTNEALYVAAGKVYIAESPTFGVSANFVAAGGGANAITATLTDSVGNNVALADGLRLIIDLGANTLQAGANTLNLNGGGAVSIVSHNNVGNNIAAAYAANGFIEVVYNSTSSVWMDMSQ